MTNANRKNRFQYRFVRTTSHESKNPTVVEMSVTTKPTFRLFTRAETFERSVKIARKFSSVNTSSRVKAATTSLESGYRKNIPRATYTRTARPTERMLRVCSEIPMR